MLGSPVLGGSWVIEWFMPLRYPPKVRLERIEASPALNLSVLWMAKWYWGLVWVRPLCEDRCIGMAPATTCKWNFDTCCEKGKERSREHEIKNSWGNSLHGDVPIIVATWALLEAEAGTNHVTQWRHDSELLSTRAGNLQGIRDVNGSRCLWTVPYADHKSGRSDSSRKELLSGKSGDSQK